MTIEAWKTSNVPGPLTSVVVDGDSAGNIIKSASNPLFITGGLILKEEAGGKKLSEYAVEIAKKFSAKGYATVATSSSMMAFKDIEEVSPLMLGAVEVVDRLKDPEWGANGKPHDLIVFLGIHYWLASQSLSTLKHFARHLKTITLCNMNHPNASWSFPNLDPEVWGKELNKVIQKL